MKNFFKKRREVITIVGYLFFVAAIVFFAIKPILAQINLKRDQIQEELAKQEDRKKQITELPKIKEQYLSIKNEGDKINVLLEQDEAVTLIEEVEKLAQNTNNEVKITISQSDPNSKEAVAAQKAAAKDKDKGASEKSITESLPSKDYLQMNMTLRGQYNDIVNFMQKIENLRYYSDILAFQIKYDDNFEGTERSSGIANPFADQKNENQEQIVVQETPVQKLTGKLDVVFYLKK